MTIEGPAEAIRQLLTLPPIPDRGRERLVGTAMHLFYYQGINPVGLDEILDEAGVTKTTFYKHFQSKNQLIVAAVKARDAWQMEGWRKGVALVAGADPRDQLLAVFEVLHMSLQEPTFRGCQFINAAAEFPNPNDPIHQAAAHHKKGFRDWIRDLARQAGAPDPEGFADGFVILFEGTLVMRQAHGRNDAALAALPHIRRLVSAYIPVD